MKKYLKNTMNGRTPQNQPLTDTQVKNSAGGYVWALDNWAQLRRFLILGSEGGTYYITEQQLTLDNVKAVRECIQEDAGRVVDEIIAVSTQGLAPKNDPALFVLAMVASFGNDEGRKLAFSVLPKIARTGTHLFSFASYISTMRGWGRTLRNGIANWYTEKESRSLAYQMVKYRQRAGWTHRDLMRKAHPKTNDETMNALMKWVTHRDETEWATAPQSPDDEGQTFIWAYEQAQRAQDVTTIVRLIEEYNLPREALPTNWLKERQVWDVLLQKMPMTAMIRNLGNMTKVGLIKPNSDASRMVVQRLTDVNRLRKARVHPISVLSALRVYQTGAPMKGRAYNPWYTPEKVWEPVQTVVDALDQAFEMAFQAIEPSNKRTLLALDVSGSMQMGMVAGVTGLTPREASTAMAMVTARTEPDYQIMAFSNKFMPLNISAKMRLNDALGAVSNLPFAGTDCALPMVTAMKKGWEVDTFIVYTDNETWYGNVHPAEALREYRQKTGIDAKLIVVGMLGNKFTIADPNDAGMMDVVGFDASAPAVMSAFARGDI